MIHKSTLAAIAAILPATVFAQGDLTPPGGAPAPGMKTLSQVEARTAIPPSPTTPIAGTHFTIGAKGSYYLTGNITITTGSAIAINASGVTLDLNGFTISSTAVTPTGTAIAVNGSDVSITGGHIAGTGFINGIFGTTANVLVTDVTVQGCQNKGIVLQGDSTAVQDCVVRTITSTSIFDSLGIQADVVKNCVATDCSNYGISGDVVSDCSAQVNANGPSASSAIGGSVITNCVARNLGAGLGITVIRLMSNCSGFSTTGTALNGGTQQNCDGVATSGGTAISCVNATNCVGQSTAVAIIANNASYCHGTRSGGGVAIQAFNAIACTVNSGSTVSATNKSLGTP